MVKVDTNIYFISTSGIIKYIGCLDKGAEEKWIGISLEEPIGTNDGTYNGYRYFDCKGEKFGIFIKQEKFIELVDKSVIRVINGDESNNIKEFDNKTNPVEPIEDNTEGNYYKDLSAEKTANEKYLESELYVQGNINHSNTFTSKKDNLISASPKISSNEKINHSDISSPLKSKRVSPSPNISSNEKLLRTPQEKQYLPENPKIKINTPETISSPFTIPNKNISLNHINYHKIEHVLYKAKYKKLKQKFTILNNKFLKNKEKFKEHKNKIDERVLHMVGHIIEANEALDNISSEFSKIMKENNLENLQNSVNLNEKQMDVSYCDNSKSKNNLRNFATTNDTTDKQMGASYCDNPDFKNNLRTVQKPINFNDTTDVFYSIQESTQHVSFIKNQKSDEKERLLFLLEKILSGFSLEGNNNDTDRYLEEYKSILAKYGIKINI